MLSAATLSVHVAIKGMPKASGEVLKFQGQLKGVAGQSASATLKAKLDETGFNAFTVKMTEARLKAAKPIVAEAKLKYDRGAFSSLRREVFLTQKAMSGLGGSSGLGSALSGALTPFGKLGTLAVGLSPTLLNVAGALGAVTSSAAAAGAGLGALAIGAGGAAAVGLGGIVAVAVPAIRSLKELTKAQKSYIMAVETYGVQSSQAETAARKLRAAERMSGKEAVSLVRSLDSVKERWASLTKPGREAFLGGLADGLARLDKKLPLLGRSANRSAQLGRKGFDEFLTAATGPDFERFVRTMTRTEEHIIPQLGKATGDWGRILERIATAAAPSLERVVGVFSKFSNHILKSTDNSQHLRQGISGLTTQFLGWVHLLTATGSLLTSIFGAGANSGLSLVKALTRQFREWGAWIDGHRGKVAEFFRKSVEGVKVLASILGHAVGGWFLMARAMEPVQTFLLKLIDSISKIKVFGQSMLTVLLGGFALLKVAIAAVKIKDLLEGFQALRALTVSTTAATEAETLAMTGQAEAATMAAAANTELAASQRLLIANSSGVVVGTAASMRAAESSAAGVGGVGGVGRLGRAAGFAGAGFLGGQVAGSVVGGKAGGILSAAGTGAGIGAGIGTFFPEFGGPVAGAAVGAGVGAAVKGLSDLLSHEKQLSPLQQRLAAESTHTADALRNQRDAALGLAKAHSSLHSAEQRQKNASNAVHQAEARLSADRQHYGADSNRVRRDELLLAAAKRRNAAATKEVSQAHQLSGSALKLYNHLTVVAAASTKVHIVDLKNEFRAQFAKFKQDESNTGAAKKAQHALSQLNGEQRKFLQLTQEAGQKSGPRLQHTLEHMTTAGAQFGTRLQGLLKIVPTFGQMTARSNRTADMAWAGSKGAVHASARSMTNDVQSMVGSVKLEIQGMDSRVAEVLKSFGVSKVSFAGGKGKQQKRQQGGFIVPGTGSGDSFSTMLPVGSFVLNREATSTFGYQAGGHVPVKLEPKERVFMPHEVHRIGRSNLAAANAKVPRFGFQKGGSLGPEPIIGGPAGKLHAAGQAAVHAVYQGAQEYVAAHKPKIAPRAGAGYIAGGGGSVEAQIASILFRHGANKIGAAGYIGNSWGESENHPDSIGSGGGGLFGFTTPPISLANLKEFAIKMHKPWTDVGLQVQFMLGHGGQGLIPAMNSQPNAAAAAAFFMNEWEHPGVPRQSVREAGARTAFAHGYLEGGPVGFAAGGPVGHPRGMRHRITGEEALEIPTQIHAGSGGSGGGSSSSSSGHGYVWPFQHASVSWGRIDEGVDFGGSGPIQAIGNATIAGAGQSGWPGTGQGFYYQLDEGPKAGKYIYVYENIIRKTSIGSKVNAGEVIATLLPSFPHLEIGWSDSTGAPLAQPSYSEGDETAAGKDFYGFLKQLSSGNGWGGGGSSAQETEHTYKEKVPAVYHGARTAKLSIGSSVPKTIHGVQREIARREGELRVYRHAANIADAQHKPAIKQALQANVTILETRLSQLRKAAAKLRREIAQKRFRAKLGRALGNVTGFQQLIEAKQRDYQEKSEFAEQVVGLEPTEPIVASNASEAQRAAAEKTYVGELGAYITGKEEPAYMAVLRSEANWRNTILSGEQTATSFEGNQELRIRILQGQIQAINDLTEKVKKDVDGWRAKQKKKKQPKKDLPDWLKGEMGTLDDRRRELPMLRFEEDERLKVLGSAREEFYGGRKNPVQPPMPPLAGSGTFEQNLIEVQGTHWPGLHSQLPVSALQRPRQAGSFGGAIWDTQTNIAELGLRMAQGQASIAGAGSTSSEEGKTPREEVLEQLLTQKNQRDLISGILGPTLAQFEASYPSGAPYMGAFAKGGVAMVGERGPELAHFPSGTRIHSNADTERMMGSNGDVQVVVNGHITQESGDSRDPIEVWMRDPQNQKLVRQFVGNTPRGVVTSGAGRTFRP